MTVLMAEPMQFVDEFRCFMLDGRVQTVSPYKRSGTLAEETNYAATSEELAAAQAFAESIMGDARVPSLPVIALDVGTTVNQRWAVVEANGAWGSGIYGCDPDAVLDVLRRASVRRERG
jgi:hypothetical protein